MVKVISAYNFQQQNTYAAFGDIVAICMIGTDRLAVAHRNFIEIQLLQRRNCESPAKNNSSQSCTIDKNSNNQEDKISFPTIDEVDQIIYCGSKNYILTLEYKSDTQQNLTDKHRTFVRVYSNFEIASSDCFSVPIRARIASKTTPNAVPNNHIEVIEIPMHEFSENSSPHLITCCQTSGTIAVCCDNRIIIFESRLCTTDATKMLYLDFFKAPFYVNLDFKPYKIALAEHVITCMNTNIVIAFKIINMKTSGDDHEVTSNSLETDSSTNIHCQQTRTSSSNDHHYSCTKFSQVIDFDLAKQFNEVNGLTMQSTIQSNWDHDSNRRSSFSEDRPCLANDIKVTLVNNEASMISNYIVKQLIQLRLQNNNVSKKTETLGTGNNNTRAKFTSKTTTVYDEFRCIALKPIYMKACEAFSQLDEFNIDAKSNDSRHIMMSDIHKCCVGFSLFLSTVSDGYVYQFTNQGKWHTENSKCLAIYPFTSPVVDIVIDSFVIHAITESGIETFSSRIGHKLFSSYFEYPMINDPYPEQTSPLVEVPICVMGICGFFGIKNVAFSAENLVLLTSDCDLNRRHNSNQHGNKSSKNRKTQMNEWTIYDLELPKPEKLVEDITHLAQIYRQSSPDVYYELIEEAHVVIRLAKELYIPCYVFNAMSHHNLLSHQSYELMIDNCFKKTCKMLADFTIRSSRKETYYQAVAYYTMCKHSILDIYISYHESNNIHGNTTNEDNHPGLIYTLTLLLSRIGSNKSSSEILSQNMPNNCACFDKKHDQIVRSLVSSDRTFAEELFDLFIKFSPRNLTQIALVSASFREILNDRLCQLYCELGEIERLQPKQKLCLTLCLCYNKKMDQALRVFETLQRSQLFNVLCESWEQILFENLYSESSQKCSFSDFTESILFTTVREDLIQATADSLIKILVIIHGIDLHLIIKLFMNYFAMNVGCAGYKTSQQILEIVLQAYFYDLHKFNDRNEILSSDDYGKQKEIQTFKCKSVTRLPNTSSPFDGSKELISGLNSKNGLTCTNMQNLYICENSEFASSSLNFTYEDSHTEAMKLLVRMYLGLLKQFSVHEQNTSTAIKSEDISTILPTVNDYRLAFIEYLFCNKDIIKLSHPKQNSNGFKTYKIQIQSEPILPEYSLNYEDTAINEDEYWRKNSFQRPILFFDQRENFLNKIPPLCIQNDTSSVPSFNDRISQTLIKLQCLLNSGKLDESLIQDVITFIHSEPNMIGVDSLLILLLPIREGSEFLIHTNPKILLDYVKVRFTGCNQWQWLLENVLIKKRDMIGENQQAAIGIYDGVIEDILRHLVLTKSLEDFFECIPDRELRYRNYPSDNENSWKLGHYRTVAQDGIDETNPFELILREAVVKQRSDSLHAMIQSSGRQLNEAVKSFHLTFN